jgi:hypothetical protein
MRYVEPSDNERFSCRGDNWRDICWVRLVQPVLGMSHLVLPKKVPSWCAGRDQKRCDFLRRDTLSQRGFACMGCAKL